MLQEGVASLAVIPAKAGIQGDTAMSFLALGPRLRGEDEKRDIWREIIVKQHSKARFEPVRPPERKE
jgi:hypothetical protein